MALFLDGGWGGGKGMPSRLKGTALAVEILLDAAPAAGIALNNRLIPLVGQV
jgi:hypothetical protein